MVDKQILDITITRYNKCKTYHMVSLSKVCMSRVGYGTFQPDPRTLSYAILPIFMPSQELN